MWQWRFPLLQGELVLSKVMSEIKELAWTIGGTGLVLITLSGQTRTWGIYISVASLVIHLIATVLSGDDN